MYSNGKSTKLAKNILVSEKCASIDYKYGPYDSIDEAWRVLKPMEVIEKGLTVGIIVNGGIEEYWFKSGTTKTDLIPKRAEINVDVQLNPSSMSPVANRIITNAILEINNKLNRNTVEVPEDSNLSEILGNTGSSGLITLNTINELLANRIVALDNRRVLKAGEYEKLDQVIEGVFYYILEEEDEEDDPGTDDPGSGGGGSGDDPGIIQGLTLKLQSGTVQNRTLILSTGTISNNTLSVSGDLI